MTKGRPNQEQYAPVSTDELLAESAPDRSLRPVDPARSNTRIALVNFFKGLFGAGVLAIPNAFESSGLPLGVAVFLLVAAVCVGTMLILLDCQRIVRERKGIEAGTYEELAGAVFGPVAFHAVQIVMALLTIIFCTGFVIVISNSLADTFPGVSRPGWCLLVFPLLTILSWIPFMKDLWATSILGLAVYLVGVVGATFYHGATNWNPPSHAMDFRWAGVMHFYGTAVYTLEGINLTLPIASSMKSRTKQSLVMIIGLSAFALITVSYSAFAFAAGDGGCDIVTKCMGHGRLTDVVKMALCVSLLATHPVYLIVASKIFERACLGDEPPPPPPLPPPQPSNSSNSLSLNHAHQHYVATAAAAEVRWYAVKTRVIRTAEVAVTCLLAAAVPHLGKFTSLVGVSGLTFIGFVMPSCLWLSLLDPNASPAAKVKVYVIGGVILAMGSLAMVVGTAEGLRALVKSVGFRWSVLNPSSSRWFKGATAYVA